MRILFLMAVSLVLVSCSAPAATGPAPTLPSPTAAPTWTPAPLTAPTVIASRGDREWDYIVLGDSISWGWHPRYAAFLKQDLGVQVNIRNWTAGGQPSSDLLQLLRTNSKLREEIREAEVITFIIPSHVFQDPFFTSISSDPSACGGADREDCWRAALQVYEADTEAIIAEIVSLRSPSEALIRIMDLHTLMFKSAHQTGVYEVLSKYTRQGNEQVIQVAARYQIPVARVYDAFMGPTGDEDPIEKGYVGSDEIHPTPKGDEVIANLFRQIGYEYARKP